MCSCLKWLEEKRSTKSDELLGEHLAAASNSQIPNQEEGDDDDEPAWIKNYAAQQAKSLKSSVLQPPSARRPLVCDEDDAAFATRLKALRPSDEAFLLPDAEDDAQFALFDDEAAATHRLPKSHTKKPRLVYASRTHSQLAQIVGEFKRLKPFADTLRLVCAASRKQLCINAAVNRDDASAARVADRCRELCTASAGGSGGGCPFFDASHAAATKTAAFAEELLRVPRDIEECVATARKHRHCAYFGVRHALADADVLLLPFALLLQPESRVALGIELSDCVVVIDEAHNLVDHINGMAGAACNASDVEAVAEACIAYQTRFKTVLTGENALFLRQTVAMARALTAAFERWSCSLRANGNDALLNDAHAKERSKNEQKVTRIFSINEFLYALRIDHFNLVKIVNFFRNQHFKQKITGFFVHAAAAKQRSGKGALLKSDESDAFSALFASFCAFEAFVECLLQPASDGKILVEAADDSRNSPLQVRYLSLYAGSFMRPICEQAKAVVLAGGTMFPTHFFTRELFDFLPSGAVVTQAFDHVVAPNRIACFTLNRGLCNGNVGLRFTHETRSDERLLDETGDTLAKLLECVPRGAVVFFASYAALTLFVERWNATTDGAMKRIARHKRVFIDAPADRRTARAQNASEMRPERLLATYAAHLAADSRNGAVLFSVVNGRLSEGINFSDDLARAVVVVGMPYPNVTSVDVAQKLAYFLAGGSGGKNASESASAFLDAACMRAVNQSVGRAIRHAFDFAAVLLLDARYAAPRIASLLPRWLQRSMHRSAVESQTEICASLKEFFAAMQHSTA